MNIKTLIISSVALAATLGATAQEKLYFGYSDQNIAGVGVSQANVYMAAAICVTPETLAQFAGNSLSGLNIGFGSGIQKSVTLFLSHDLNGTPFYTQAAKIRQVRHWNEIDLTTPLPIDAGATEPLYVGYYVKTATERDFQLGVDESLVYTDRSCLMSFATVENEMWGAFQQRGPKYGNATISLVITGDNLPRDNGAVTNMVLPAYATPGNPFDITANVRNNGCNPVQEVTLAYTIGDGPEQTAQVSFDTPVAPGETGTAKVTGCTTDQDNPQMPVTMWVSCCNGNEVASPQTCTQTFPCSFKVFERRVVVEEATGTWCGNCPVGYAGMEMMKENADLYPAFIGIAMHNRSGSQEPMHCSTYEDIVQSYISGFPQALVNRDPAFGAIQPDIKKLPVAYAIAHGVTNSGVEVSSYLKDDGATLHVTATMASAIDTDNADMSLSFVLTEDNVGPYMQTNYFNDKPSSGLAEWFETQPYVVELMYNDVARYLEGPFGISGSVPGQMRVGQTYTYEMDLPTADCGNMDNVFVTAMLLDNASGCIVNAARARAGQSGIGQVAQQGDLRVRPVAGGVEISGQCTGAVAYDLRGRACGVIDGAGRMELPGGIYIVKASNGNFNQSHKIIVK